MKISYLLKKKKVIIFSFVILLIFISAFFVFDKRNAATQDIIFLNVNEKKADSILANLSLEEKVKQILFVNHSFCSGNITGGIIFDTLNIDTLEKQKLDSSVLKPFIFYKSNLTFPIFSKIKTERPSFLAFSSIRDTAFLRQYINFNFYIDSIFGINFIYIPFDENILRYTDKDSALVAFCNNLTNRFIQKYSSSKQLLGISFIDYSQLDSSMVKKMKEYYTKIFQKGVNYVLTQDVQASILAKNTGFRGIIITKITDIKSVGAFFNSPADMIFSDNSHQQLFNAILKLTKRKKKYERLLNAKVKKIIMAKIWLNENKNKQIDSSEIKALIENKSIDVFNRKIIKKSIVTVNNNDNFLPVKNLFLHFSIYNISEQNNFKTFNRTINKYVVGRARYLSIYEQKDIKKIKIPSSGNLIFTFDTIPNKELISYLYSLDSVKNIIVVFFGSVNDLVYFKKFKHLIYSYQANEISQFYAAQLIFGGISSCGEFPDFIADNLSVNKGQRFNKIRLGYDIPEMVGLKSKVLSKIDSIAEAAIRIGAFPGCQIFIAKEGTIIWNKAYGFHTYSRKIRVKPKDLYDLASVTKIAATTLAAMKMYEKGKLPLDVNIGKYFKDTKIQYDRIKPDTTVHIDTLNINEIKNWKQKIKNTDTSWLNDSIIVSYDTAIYTLTPRNNIFKVSPRQLLMHKSGIQPAMPILKQLLIVSKKFIRIRDLYEKYDEDSLIGKVEALRKKIYSPIFIKDSAEIPVAKNMFMRNNYLDTLWKDTKQLPVTSKKNYVYSDVNMILLQMTIDSINGYSISKFVRNNFYRPLYLTNICYRPLEKFNKNMIIPTENDKYWRKQLVWGYVHDPSAAILGQIAGNAGLFSNAFSLGVLGQMLLNGGTYGSTNFLSEKTIDKFTQTQKDSERGLGFDKWHKRQIIARDASHRTYGHTGFTGTCMWVDPDNKIIFVFLSNRVNPSAENWRINRYRIRQKIHQTVYDAMK